jgi:outer membrane biosynthesis protein TonB
MRLDRAELTGTGAALLFHVALIAALTLSLADVDVTPEPPSMEVEFVEEVGLESAAPTSIAMPPPVSQAPEIGEAQPTEAAPPPPTPVPAPRPQPRAAPTPPRPAPVARPRPAQPRPAPRVSRIGDDFLKGIDSDDEPSAAPARPAAPAFNATARASIGQSIIRPAQRCADRQPFLGEGANKVRLTVNLKFSRSGRLSRPPSILRSAGDPDARAQFGDQLEDQVRRIFADCSPFRLPADLYDTPSGGWKDFTFTYRVD